MQCDDVVWNILKNFSCSFKSKISKERAFCRNEYNVTGLCNRSHCPLANSKYATVREENGVCYLFTKSIERAHSPKNLWEKVELSKDYGEALDQVSEHLKYFSKIMIHQNKLRLTKLHQYIIRKRRLRLTTQPKLVRISKKFERREVTREKKAETAAKLEFNIENELLERLKTGTYGSIYNFPAASYVKALDRAQEENEAEVERELETNQPILPVEYVEDSTDDDIDEYQLKQRSDFSASRLKEAIERRVNSAAEASEVKKRKSGADANETMDANGQRKQRKKPSRHVELEYELENERMVETNMAFNW